MEMREHNLPREEREGPLCADWIDDKLLFETLKVWSEAYGQGILLRGVFAKEWQRDPLYLPSLPPVGT